MLRALASRGTRGFASKKFKTAAFSTRRRDLDDIDPAGTNTGLHRSRGREVIPADCKIIQKGDGTFDCEKTVHITSTWEYKDVTVGSMLDNAFERLESFPADSTVAEAVIAMADRNIGALLIVPDIEEGTLSSPLFNHTCIFTERDWINLSKRMLLANDDDLTRLDAWTTKVGYVARDEGQLKKFVKKSDSVMKCIEVMLSGEERTRYLAVVDDDEVNIIAVVSLGDLMKMIAKAACETVAFLEDYIGGKGY